MTAGADYSVLIGAAGRVICCALAAIAFFWALGHFSENLMLQWMICWAMILVGKKPFTFFNVPILLAN